MGVWLGPYRKKGIKEEDFQYSGQYIFASDEHGNWELALLTGNTTSLYFLKTPGKVDLFLVAGGKTASYYPDTPQNAYQGPSHGGIGGNGGETITKLNEKLVSKTSYNITIGNSDENTIFSGGGINFVAGNNEGITGGTGGLAAYDTTVDAPAPSDGIYAYNENSDTLMFTEQQLQGHRFGAPGGGGGSMVQVNQYSSQAYASNALGGESNGLNHEYGKGGSYGSKNGSSGYANHGQGGGGPYYWWTGSVSRYGDGTDAALGKGGSGIIIIRNHRS